MAQRIRLVFSGMAHSALILLTLGVPFVGADEAPTLWSTGIYQYDPAGNIVAIGSDSYVYDTNSRLTSAAVPSVGEPASQAFSYDPFGNIVAKSLNGTPLALAVDSSTNHLTGPYSSYDDAGNLTAWQGQGGVVYQARYDGLHMMQELRDSTGRRTANVYTADDQRLWTFDAGSNASNAGSSASHWKIRDLEGRVLRDYRESGGTWGVAKDYLHRDRALLSALAPSTGRQEHFSLDHLGSPRLVTDAAGVPVARHTYLPFGEEWAAPGPGEDEPMKFTGHERDVDPASSGNDLDYMHARYYTPNVGRFLSVDPLEGNPRQPQSWNRYAYVQNNPTNRTDPSGQCGESAKFIGPTQPCTSNETQPKPAPQAAQAAGGRTPAQGQEPGTQTFPNADGGKTVRTYGPDGKAVTDVDYGHDHGAGDPHVHDWNWNNRPPRGQGRAPNTGEIPEPSKSLVIGPRGPDTGTIITAVGLALFGTAAMIMTGGAMALQPSAAGVVLVPRSSLPTRANPLNPRDCDCI
jgi:RHS repeat-associated protein